MALWGGRFDGDTSDLFKALNDSLPFDRALVMEDIEGSIAWARALGRAKVLKAADVSKLVKALESIAERESDPATAKISSATDEDVHSFVERELIALVGDLGKKLHTGRSRNDQVATDVRLWTASAIVNLRRLIAMAIDALVSLADAELKKRTVLPGYTHLQRGQPVLFAHWCLAYVEMLRRDHERFGDALSRVCVSPLGSGALAGTAYPIDREALATDLGFLEASRNSLDAAGDRDFVFETLSTIALCGVHLSRLGEDLIFYSSSEFGFIQMSDRVTSGSSLMPQKKNPDAAELLRGKSGRLIGNLVRIATTLKGLPLAYNKDLQEDKEPLFDSVAHLTLCLRIVPECVSGITINRDRMRAAADDGFSAATDLADYLVRAGVPFRDAHHIAGRLTRTALELRVPLHRLTLEQMRAIEPRIGPDIFKELSIEAVLAKRDVVGGTAIKQVRKQIRIANASVKAMLRV
jgi:argininosuccinate lyase/amino-acid N-acetyltransferase